MTQRVVRVGWLSFFGAVFVAPVVVRLATTAAEPMWRQLADITGLLALSALVCAAILPSRVRSLTRAFGIEGVLDVHRFLGTATGVLVLLHLACVVAADPAKVALLDFAAAGPAPRAATISTLALCALIVLAVLRGRSKSSYEHWRWLHIALAATVVGAGALHVWWLDQLVTEPGMEAVFALMAGLLLAVLVNRWLWRSLLDPTSEFVVRDVRRETPTVSTLVLQPRIARHSR